MDKVTLSGGLSWLFSICILLTTGTTIILGTWIIFNYFIWDVLVKHAMIWLSVYRNFVHFIYYRKRFLAWFKKYEGKFEPGAND